MKHILLDTNAYAAFKQGKKAAIEIIRHAPVVGINSVVLGELLAGFAKGNRNTENRKELQSFLRSSRVVMLSVDMQTAEDYAQIYLHLKQKGQPIPTNDIWIAASARQHDFAIFTF